LTNQTSLRVDPHLGRNHPGDGKPAHPVGKKPDHDQGQPGQKQGVAKSAPMVMIVSVRSPCFQAAILPQKYAQQGRQDNGGGKEQHGVGQPIHQDIDTGSP
jgi:hypothetical protein